MRLLLLCIVILCACRPSQSTPTRIFQTNTYTPTDTPTETPTLTPTETPSPTATDTLTPSETASNTATDTRTPTETFTATFTPSKTPTPLDPTPTREPAPQGALIKTEADFRKCIAVSNSKCLIAGTIVLTARTTIRARGVTVIGFGQSYLTNSVGNVYAILEAVDTSDITIKNVHLRRTPNTAKASTGDGLSFVRCQRCRAENISVAWSIDGGIDLHQCNDCAVTGSIIAEALRLSTHSEGGHSMCMLVDSSSNVLIQGNLFISCKERNPRVISSQSVTIRNNLIYNYGSHPTVVSADRGISTVNYWDNKLIAGPDSPAITYGVAVTNPVSAIGVYADKKAVRVSDWRYVVGEPYGTLGEGVVFDMEGVGAMPRDSVDTHLVDCISTRLCVIVDKIP